MDAGAGVDGGQVRGVGRGRRFRARGASRGGRRRCRWRGWCGRWRRGRGRGLPGSSPAGYMSRWACESMRGMGLGLWFQVVKFDVRGTPSHIERSVDDKGVIVLYIQIYAHDKGVMALYIQILGSFPCARNQARSSRGQAGCEGRPRKTERFVDDKRVTVLYIQICAHGKGVTALYIQIRFRFLPGDVLLDKSKRPISTITLRIAG